jgi:hypothetical protein
MPPRDVRRSFVPEHLRVIRGGSHAAGAVVAIQLYGLRRRSRFMTRLYGSKSTSIVWRFEFT